MEWSADYLELALESPTRGEPGEVFRELALEPMEAIFADLDPIIMPGITHWQHPRFFAYFPANASPPSIIAEFITTALATQCMLWQTSPAATELETRVLDWLRQMIGLGQAFQVLSGTPPRARRPRPSSLPGRRLSISPEIGLGLQATHQRGFTRPRMCIRQLTRRPASPGLETRTWSAIPVQGASTLRWTRRRSRRPSSRTAPMASFRSDRGMHRRHQRGSLRRRCCRS